MSNNDIILSQIRQRLEILYQMVDELEREGGGGGGGTTNYNELNNKPSVNGVVLMGNKTTSDLGIVENVQANWNETNSAAPSYIKNKPTIPTPVTVDQTYRGTSTNAQSGTAVTQAISTKVDKETGKGLSTNDFTNADKANLATALQKANAAAPQSTTYTKTEVNTALAAKLNISDVDSALSSISTNPVQNKAVHAPIARLVDAGAKNIAAIGAVPSRSDLDIQVTDGHVSISGTVNGSITWQVAVFDNFVCEKDMVVIGAETRTGISYQCRYTDSGGRAHYDQIPDGGILTIPAGSTIQYLYFQQNTGGVYVSIEVDVMVCTAEDYAISSKFVPYAPSNRELFEEKIDHDIPALTESILGYAVSLPTGIYFARHGSSSGVDKPVTGHRYMYQIMKYTAATITIIAYDGEEANSNSIYMKNYTSSTWGPWIKFTGTVVT